MKRFLLTGIAVMLLMALALAINAASPTNFTGVWLLNHGQTVGLPPQMDPVAITWTIAQDDKQIKIDVKRNPEGQMGPMPTAIYNLDGSETTQELTGRMTGKAKRKAKWLEDGKILELSAVSELEAQGNSFTITSTDHLELTEGGKVLKVHRQSESQRGKQEIDFVFNKQ